MSKISYTNIAGEKVVCACTQYAECNMECSVYRKIIGKQTNADRIRQMSDEELARFIARQAGRYCDYKDPEDEEYARILPWLKSPVEVDNGT